MKKQKNFKISSPLGLQSLARLLTQGMLLAALALVLAPGGALCAQTGTLGKVFPMYVTSFNNNSGIGEIVKVDGSGNQTVFSSGGNIAGPLGLAFDSSGNLYVANLGFITPHNRQIG
ncbi:MAG: hypothetical protein JOZ29_18825 [Deltaproteobacteria bacterium]|nr:hypothetical protein [Deltaproteobacteria bacterium]